MIIQTAFRAFNLRFVSYMFYALEKKKENSELEKCKIAEKLAF